MVNDFDYIRRELSRIGVFTTTFQRRPNTCVIVSKIYNGRAYTGLGFSKAMHPDEWNAVFGIELAKDRALTDLALQILMDENGKEGSNGPA